MTEQSYAHLLRITFPMRCEALSAVFQDFAASLHSGPASVLDIGCGIGLQTLLLADFFHPQSRFTGLDMNHDNLAHARKYAEKLPGKSLVSFVHGDFTGMQIADNAFDAAVSIDALGYAPLADTTTSLHELIRVLKPGGRILIAAWTSQMLLPGYPLLEARLNTTPSGLAPYRKGSEPGHHFLCLAGLLKSAGFMDIHARTYAGSIQGPLDADMQQAVACTYGMRWSDVESALTAEEARLYKALTEPASPDFLPARPDFYAFFTYTAFSASLNAA